MTKLFSFKGGVYPPENKLISITKHIGTLPSPKYVVIPIQQHIGNPANPIVQVGDMVKAGEIIAEPNGFMSVGVHSSISGKVKEIALHPHPNGKNIQSIVIESDGKDEHISFRSRYKEYFRLPPKELRNVLQTAGIVGLGGASFPTHVKLTPKTDFLIDTVILNGCECEPYLTCDEMLMEQFSLEIINGLQVIMYILEADRGIIAIEEDKPKAIASLTEELKKIPNIELKLLKRKYPQGAEKQLIYALLKRVVPSGKLPLDVGVVVNNVATSFAIYEIIFKGKPLFERVVTITGNAVENPQNFWIKIGTPLSYIIQFVKVKTPIKKVIIGGPMMGLAQHSLDVPVIKSSSGILLFSDKKEEKENTCIRCGKCIEVCPINLFPTTIAQYVKVGDWQKIKEYHPLDCIECGACAYICPANIPLVQYIKIAKEKYG